MRASADLGFSPSVPPVGITLGTIGNDAQP
jgi:hypothetical protein